LLRIKARQLVSHSIIMVSVVSVGSAGIKG